MNKREQAWELLDKCVALKPVDIHTDEALVGYKGLRHSKIDFDSLVPDEDGRISMEQFRSGYEEERKWYIENHPEYIEEEKIYETAISVFIKFLMDKFDSTVYSSEEYDKVVNEARNVIKIDSDIIDDYRLMELPEQVFPIMMIAVCVQGYNINAISWCPEYSEFSRQYSTYIMAGDDYEQTT
jgi:hypothetical protein